MEVLLSLDSVVFQWINNGWSSGLLDWLLPVWRNKLFWIPFYVFVILFFVINFKKTGIIAILGLFVTVGIADYTSSKIIKPSVERIRPCNDTSLDFLVIERINCGSGYSFPSSHATNHFAFAGYLGLVLLKLHKLLPLLLFFWAGSISLAQVYVGVHYPIDIFCGAILGTCIGLLNYFLLRKRVQIMPQQS